MRKTSTVFAALVIGATVLAAPAGAQASSATDDWKLNPAGTWETEYGCVSAGSQGYLGGAWKEFRCEYIGAFGWRMWIRTGP
ncbi:hypothetical protein ACGFNU_34795 [Spirillospora sp. NPDC048911]|uniref:hypothetical protein n=1 Tax=Spirillospora sp. NPDC048911 TaxID=3364527 RepID=UPI0037197575